MRSETPHIGKLLQLEIEDIRNCIEKEIDQLASVKQRSCEDNDQYDALMNANGTLKNILQGIQLITKPDTANSKIQNTKQCLKELLSVYEKLDSKHLMINEIKKLERKANNISLTLNNLYESADMDKDTEKKPEEFIRLSPEVLDVMINKQSQHRQPDRALAPAISDTPKIDFFSSILKNSLLPSGFSADNATKSRDHILKTLNKAFIKKKDDGKEEFILQNNYSGSIRLDNGENLFGEAAFYYQFYNFLLPELRKMVNSLVAKKEHQEDRHLQVIKKEYIQFMDQVLYELGRDGGVIDSIVEPLQLRHTELINKINTYVITGTSSSSLYQITDVIQNTATMKTLETINGTLLNEALKQCTHGLNKIFKLVKVIGKTTMQINSRLIFEGISEEERSINNDFDVIDLVLDTVFRDWEYRIKDRELLNTDLEKINKDLELITNQVTILLNKLTQTDTKYYALSLTRQEVKELCLHLENMKTTISSLDKTTQDDKNEDCNNVK